MKYATYEKYTDSPLEWSGPIPAHWQIKKIGHLVLLKSGENIVSEEIAEGGKYSVFGGNGFRGYFNQYTHDGNFVLIGRQGALCGNINYASGKFWASDHALVAHPLAAFDLRWFGETLRAMNLNQYSVSAAQPGLAASAISALRLPFPPIDEQQTIARFLDAKTAQIDTLVAQKRQLIAKLKEKRQALIARTVTRGLPLEAAKAAGLEMDSDSKCSKEIHPLIGSLPMGWRSLKLRRVATIQGGYAFKSDDFQQEGIPVVRMNSLKRGVLELEGAACIDERECIEAVALKIGDVLYGMSGSVGETGSLGNFAVVRDSDVPCQLNQRVGRFLVQKKELLPGFLVYLIQAPYFYDQILLQATGTAQFNVSGGQIESVLIALPSLDAQRLMVDFLGARCAEIDALQRKTEQALESLYEFRMAIVTSAVTGKIDVRGVA